jgi:hypothetical protein
MLIDHRDAIAAGAFPDSPLRDARRLLAPSRLTWALAHLRRGGLDRELAAGADPRSCPLLAARAAQLTDPGRREEIALGLERLTVVADGTAGRTRVTPSRRAVRANRSLLLELAAALRRTAPVYARGVALLEIVITDGTGPAYTDRTGDELARELATARAALAS